MDNTEASAPQIGLGSADLVVEELVEGGLTRLAAFYYSDLPDGSAGPFDARSDIGIVSPVDATIATSGAAGVTIGRSKGAGIPFTGGSGGLRPRQLAQLAVQPLRQPAGRRDRGPARQATRPQNYLPWGAGTTSRPAAGETIAASFGAGTRPTGPTTARLRQPEHLRRAGRHLPGRHGARAAGAGGRRRLSRPGGQPGARRRSSPGRARRWSSTAAAWSAGPGRRRDLGSPIAVDQGRQADRASRPAPGSSWCRPRTATSRSEVVPPSSRPPLAGGQLHARLGEAPEPARMKPIAVSTFAAATSGSSGPETRRPRTSRRACGRRSAAGPSSSPTSGARTDRTISPDVGEGGRSSCSRNRS